MKKTKKFRCGVLGGCTTRVATAHSVCARCMGWLRYHTKRAATLGMYQQRVGLAVARIGYFPRRRFRA